jgi:phage baseplate assembly protein W
MNMITYGINFPFLDSLKGDYVRMTGTKDEEIRSNLIHLLLTRKGSRYCLPDFGTRIYEYIFDPNDSITYDMIEEEIREGVKKYIPNLQITSISITPPDEENSTIEYENQRLFKTSNNSSTPYTAKIKLDFNINNGAFSSSDFVIINI